MMEPSNAKTKVTLLLPSDVVRSLRAEVERGAAHSQSSLVKEAVVEYLARARERELREEYARAARDPEFLADVERTMRDFRGADAETEGCAP
ncbi:MAG: hypothetical protein HY775_05445 [Acidobacteria bacterium]|nr:hypothetical protein [Acidobacteriota bacterium]